MVQCKATCKTGLRCKRNAKSGSEVCGIHASQGGSPAGSSSSPESSPEALVPALTLRALEVHEILANIGRFMPLEKIEKILKKS